MGDGTQGGAKAYLFWMLAAALPDAISDVSVTERLCNSLGWLWAGCGERPYCYIFFLRGPFLRKSSAAATTFSYLSSRNWLLTALLSSENSPP